MAKRIPETEAPEAEPVPEVPPTVGERLRAAREQKKLSLEDVAAQTRIPQRHLASIESAEWDSLPAPTYTIGFAKNYAGVVGLDRAEIGDQLREEMGGQRFATTSADVFEPADPRRTMPRSLVIGAVIAAVLLIALILAVRSTVFPVAVSEVPAGEERYPLTRLGQALLGDYLLPFEIVSVLLLVVMIGAAYLAKARRRETGMGSVTASASDAASRQARAWS